MSWPERLVYSAIFAVPVFFLASWTSALLNKLTTYGGFYGMGVFYLLCVGACWWWLKDLSEN